MLSEGLGEEDAIDIISRLLPGHCRNGPAGDHDGSPGDVMTFRYPYTSLFPPCERVMLYIKLKIWTDSRGEAGIVMSFHPEGIV